MPSNERIVVYEFNSKYFSGLDLNVYFGDYLMDEIINIQYQLSESVTPLYDYASYRYKTVVKGNRVIQGSFSVNFTSSFKMKEILNKALNGPENVADAITQTEQAIGIETPINLPQSLTTVDINNLLAAENRNQRTGLLADIAKHYQKTYWTRAQGDIGAPDTNIPFFSSNPVGFTIYLKYMKKLFDYDVVPSTTEAYKQYVGTNAPKTMEAITNVHITSVGKAVDDSGKNLLEVYSFIGRDLVFG